MCKTYEGAVTLMEGTLNCAVLTVSDTRTLDSDTSGRFLCDAVTEAGHMLGNRQLVPDDRYELRAVISRWIADPAVEVIITTGGTGFTGRDTTPDAVLPLLDVEIPGFGELFRQLSYQEIGTSTVQSRAVAGIANNTLIFCVPGSTGACKTVWEGILAQQLDINNRPCNFAELIKTGAH